MNSIAARSFLSYRRTRAAEAGLLIEAQQNVGVPTWQDIANLREEQTEDALRHALSGSATSNAVLLITPEIRDSAAIQTIEIPSILKRLENDSSFFLVPVAAGGVDYSDVASLVSSRSSLTSIAEWNLRKISNDPMTYRDAANVAQSVLSRRIERLERTLPAGEPIDLGFYTAVSAPAASSHHLSIDWSRHFRERQAPDDVWEQKLLPALHTLSECLRKYAPGRSIVASGHPFIPAALALGSAFLAPRRQHLVWNQYTLGKTQNWSITESPVDSGFRSTIEGATITGRDMAVCVSVASSVIAAFSRLDRNRFRCVVHVQKGEKYPQVIASPGEAVHLAQLISGSIREARARYQIETVHLFVALPVGLAMMIGQYLNTVGDIRTYEYIPVGGDGMYHAAAKICPSMAGVR